MGCRPRRLRLPAWIGRCRGCRGCKTCRVGCCRRCPERTAGSWSCWRSQMPTGTCRPGNRCSTLPAGTPLQCRICQHRMECRWRRHQRGCRSRVRTRCSCCYPPEHRHPSGRRSTRQRRWRGARWSTSPQYTWYSSRRPACWRRCRQDNPHRAWPPSRLERCLFGSSSTLWPWSR